MRPFTNREGLMKRLLPIFSKLRAFRIPDVRSKVKIAFKRSRGALTAAQEAASQAFALLIAGWRALCLLGPRWPRRHPARAAGEGVGRRFARTLSTACRALLIGLLLGALRVSRLRIPKAPWPPICRRIGARLGRLGRGLFARDRGIFGGLLLLAGLMRFMEMDAIPFGPGEAYPLAQAETLLRSLGSSGLPERAPLLAILLAIPVALNRDPRWAAGFVALLNVGALALFYAALRRYWGRRLAALVGLLVAVLPWAVLPARSLAPEGFLLPLGLVVFSVLLSGIEGRNPWAWAAAPLAAGLAFFASPWGLTLVFILAVAILFYWRRVRWGYVALGCALLALAAGPYLDSLLRAKGNLAGLWASSPAPNAPLLEGLSPFMALLAQRDALLEGVGYFIYGLWGASLVLSVWGTFYAWSHWQAGQPISRYLLSAIWNGAILLAVALKPMPLAPRELAALLVPGSAVGVALILDLSALLPRGRHAQRRSRAAVWLGLIPWVVCLALVLWGVYAVGLIEASATEGYLAGYGKTYYAWREAREAVLREARTAQGDQVWIVEVAAPAPWEAQGQPLRYLLGQEMGAATLYQKPGAILLPAERPGVYVRFGEAPWLERLIAYLGEGTSLPRPQGDLLVNILPARRAEEMLALIPERTLYSFDAGLHLVGYQWPEAHSGEIIALATYWAFWDIPPREQAFAHRLVLTLADAQGRPLAQSEGLGLEAHDWQEGLLLEQWHLLDLAGVPPGAYALVVRLERSDGTLCLYVSETGTPLGSGVALGPVTVLPRLKP